MCSDSDVEIFRDWLKKQKHLPQNVDDYYIIAFINSAKGSMQKAKKRFEKFRMVLQMFNSLNAHYIQWDPFSEQEMDFTNRFCVSRLPNKSPEGYSILFAKVYNEEYDDDGFGKYNGIFIYLILCLLWEHDMDDKYIILFDWSNTTARDLKALRLDHIRTLAMAMQGGTPLRIHAVIDFNIPSMFEFIFNLVKKTLSEKMNSRRFAYSKVENVFDHVPQSYFPSDYGGNGPSCDELKESTLQLFRKHRERLKSIKAELMAEKPFLPAEFQEDTTATFRKLEFD